MVGHHTTLKTEDLIIGYREGKHNKMILNHVDIQLKEGELVCLMGPNGIGKSTLIRTLCGLQDALGGKVFVLDQALDSISESDRSKLLSVVLTDRIQGGNLTVEELIVMGRYPYVNWLTKLKEDDYAAVDNAINAVAIKDILLMKLHQLSDGQLQRAMITRALAQDGEVMILDEPTAHLDLNNRVEVMRLLRRLAHEHHKTILMATHELDLALQLADRMILIQPDLSIVNGLPEDLVLNGSLDNTFGLKGYDLKTGKAEFIAHKAVKIYLVAEGHYYLWSKNFLERNGFEVVNQENDSSIKLNVSGSENAIHCLLDTEGKIDEVDSFEELIGRLNSL